MKKQPFLATVIAVALAFLSINPVRAQGCVICIWLPLVVSSIANLTQRISDPIGIPPGSNLQADESPAVIECTTHNDGHARIWIEKSGTFVPRSGDVFNLRYNFFDGVTPDYTYLPDAEQANLVPAKNWEWTVTDPLATAVANDLRQFGQGPMADKVVEMKNRQPPAVVQVFQINRGWATRGVPVFCNNGMYDNTNRYSGEIWGPDSQKAK